MSAANIQGVQWVPGVPDSIVNWSTDLKLYKITIGPREYKPSNSEIVAVCGSGPAFPTWELKRLTLLPRVKVFFRRAWTPRVLKKGREFVSERLERIKLSPMLVGQGFKRVKVFLLSEQAPAFAPPGSLG